MFSYYLANYTDINYRAMNIDVIYKTMHIYRPYRHMRNDIMM